MSDLFHVCLVRVVRVKNPQGDYDADMVEDFYNLTRDAADVTARNMRPRGAVTIFPQDQRKRIDHEVNLGGRTIKMQRGVADKQIVIKPVEAPKSARSAPLATPTYADLVNKMGAEQ